MKHPLTEQWNWRIRTNKLNVIKSNSTTNSHVLKEYWRLSFVLFFLLTHIQFAKAQFGFEYNPSIKVVKDGIELQNPWAGGLDYTQFSVFDFDFDGDDDLFLFDRSTNNIRVFTQEVIGGVSKWKFHYNAAAHFPQGIEYRATMVDFDMDGKKDLFTYSIGGLRVYKNIGNSTDGIQWQLHKNIVQSNYNGFLSNLYIASSDIPAIVDVDNDGDIDVLTFHQGGSHLEYHKNMSMELYGIPDSLTFQLANECWGKFSENINNNSILLNDPNFPCEEGTLPNPELPPLIESGNEKSENNRHAGSTVLALDLDNNGVLDLILGDVAYTNLVALINGGTTPNSNSAMVSFDVNYPSNSTPANMYLFPAPYFLDVDFDGKKDLIVGANAKNVSHNETSILYYKNMGTTNQPTFVFQRNNFLQNEMIEHGKGSIPILYDVDKDGLTDLLVSNLYRFKNESTKEGTIAYYKNTGTATQPVFTLIDFNWLNLNSLNYGLRLVPTFGDINGDGKDEMILGRENGSLVLFQNNGTTFTSPTINMKDDQHATIQVGGFSYPQLIDLNNDGLLDLVIGNRTGKIVYYENIGTSTNPVFQLKNSTLGNIQIQDPNNPDGYTAPHFFRHNDTLQLFLGAVDGKFYYYNGIEEQLNTGDAFYLVSSNFLGINVEGYSSFAIGDINNNGEYNLFVGQDLGGLYHFEADPSSSIGVEELNMDFKLELFPNPTSNQLTIRTNTKGKIELILYSIDGQQVQKAHFYDETTLDVSTLKNGIYLIETTIGSDQKSTKRLVKY